MSYMKPTIKLSAKNPQFAILGHILAMLGGAIAIVAGILGLLNFVNAILGILTGIFILIVELDRVDLSILKDPLIRGIVWIILAIAAIGLGWWASLLTIVSGILYLVYHFS